MTGCYRRQAFPSIAVSNRFASRNLKATNESGGIETIYQTIYQTHRSREREKTKLRQYIKINGNILIKLDIDGWNCNWACFESKRRSGGTSFSRIFWRDDSCAALTHRNLWFIKPRKRKWNAGMLGTPFYWIYWFNRSIRHDQATVNQILCRKIIY